MELGRLFRLCLTTRFVMYSYLFILYLEEQLSHNFVYVRINVFRRDAAVLFKQTAY
jgi:hypothetical protein